MITLPWSFINNTLQKMKKAVSRKCVLLWCLDLQNIGEMNVLEHEE